MISMDTCIRISIRVKSIDRLRINNIGLDEFLSFKFTIFELIRKLCFLDSEELIIFLSILQGLIQLQ